MLVIVAISDDSYENVEKQKTEDVRYGHVED